MKSTVYAGTQNSLQFPVMCDAYVELSYSENIAEEPIGLWDMEGSFTMEMIVTPYDINGYGNHTTDDTVNSYMGKQTSSKTMPSRADGISTSTQDNRYIPIGDRLKQEMVLFYNEYFDVKLINKTKYSQNNPAEYAIQARMTLNGVDVLCESTRAVTSRKEHYYLDSSNCYNYLQDKHGAFAVDSGFNVGSVVGGSGINVATGDPRTVFHTEMTAYDSNGNDLGEIILVNATTIIFKNDFATSPAGNIYIPVEREALYLLSPYHIAVSYNNASKHMSLFVNGSEVASRTHTETTTFTFAKNDIYLGQNPTGGTAQLKRNSQFMGEYHELAISSGYKNTFTSLYTIDTQYRELLLYLDFEEVDE